MTYFFDTYAMIEILKGNRAYEKYKQHTLVGSVLNLGEYYEYLLRRFDGKTAVQVFSGTKVSELPIERDVVTDAVHLRRRHAAKKLSWADAIGYALARKHGLKFLTGDSEFRKLPGVEFVK